jgi:hypothetical protein
MKRAFSGGKGITALAILGAAAANAHAAPISYSIQFLRHNVKHPNNSHS